jgi:hypothetical protein
LSLIGLCVNRFCNVDRALAEAIPLRHGIAHGDMVKAYVGQLCLGKSDFEAIESVRNDEYFRTALSIQQMPSSARLRQRFDENAQPMLEVLYDSSIDFLERAAVPVSALPSGHVVLDIDVFPMDNSKTKKEGVSRTYKGFDGYAPIAAYLGQEGWCLACELREGAQHCQNEFLYTLERVLPNARRLTDAPLLVRLDGGHDAFDTRAALTDEAADFIIKWNPRQQDLDAWLECAESEVEAGRSTWKTPREGKRIATFSLDIKEQRKQTTVRCRRVMQVIERTIDKRGQRLLVPEIEIEGWWTSLDASDFNNEAIMALYRDHATSEQYHSEFKTDLDLERLPSGKFATNDLIMTLAAFSYNILRWIGLIGLMGEVSPVRHPAKRRRLKTVMQELMYLAAHVIRTGRRLKLRFSKHCPAYRAFENTYARLAYG